MDPKLNVAQDNEPTIERIPDEAPALVLALSEVDLQMVGGGENVPCW